MPFSPKRAGSVAYSLVMFVIVSVLAGVLIAGLFVPLAGMAGVTGKATAAELESLPTELGTPAPPTRSPMGPALISPEGGGCQCDSSQLSDAQLVEAWGQSLVGQRHRP